MAQAEDEQGRVIVTCGPCASCLGLLVGFAVAVCPFGWAGSAVYLGYTNLKNCPSKPEIPIWCYGFGATLATMLWLLSHNESRRRALARFPGGNADNYKTPMQNMMQVFLLCWMVYGSFLVYACDDCTESVRPFNSSDPSNPATVGCQPTLFQFAYISLILCWTVAPALFCIVFTTFVCCGSFADDSDRDPDHHDSDNEDNDGDNDTHPLLYDGSSSSRFRWLHRHGRRLRVVDEEVPPMYTENDPLLGPPPSPPPLTPPPLSSSTLLPPDRVTDTLTNRDLEADTSNRNPPPIENHHPHVRSVENGYGSTTNAEYDHEPPPPID
eukprot:m.30213 g.30213  ORF g.30213 m.30213 type:complete len:325 (-) comp4679_c0_seq1:111-1085(-)